MGGFPYYQTYFEQIFRSLEHLHCIIKTSRLLSPISTFWWILIFSENPHGTLSLYFKMILASKKKNIQSQIQIQGFQKMQADIEQEVMKKKRETLIAMATASPTRPGSDCHVPKPTEGILAPVLSSKNRMSSDISRR